MRLHHRGGVKRVTAAPTDYTNLIGWWKAGTLSGNDGDAIGTWNDSSSAGRNATQATAGKKPLLRLGRFLSLPGLQFDNTDDVLGFTVTGTLANHSVIAVMRNIAASPSNLILGRSGAANSVYLSNTAPVVINVTDGLGNTANSANFAASPSSPFLAAATFAVGGNINLYEGKTNRLSAAWPGNNQTFDSIGDPTSFWNLNSIVGEIAIWDSILSGANIANLYDNYYAPTYGVQ